MMYLGDMLLESPVTDEQVARAAAVAFGVSRVTVWPMAQVTDRGADILMQRGFLRGDFPYLMRFTATPASGIDNFSDKQFVDAVRAMAHALDQDILTDTGVQYQDNFLVVTPLGDTLEVSVDDDGLDDDRIELTPESKRRLCDLAAQLAR
jgi:hypothetical protein